MIMIHIYAVVLALVKRNYTLPGVRSTVLCLKPALRVEHTEDPEAFTFELTQSQGPLIRKQ